ncbi:hypothetical protein [Micromonospora sp. CPCC 206061]|uniref:hypothetical protein n=1 Tax=Micromonospora sp. CPCC 206061 TaxID=3122410 RepID=UPI002FEF26E0
MRIMVTALTLTAMALTAAACGDDEPAQPEPGGDANASPTPGGPFASCLVGDWRSTGVEGRAGGDVASATIQGGGGVAVTIQDSGEVRADFRDMRPITFTARLGDADLQGEFSYAGEASGTFRTETVTPGGTAPASGFGVWEPVGPVDWEAVRLTLRLTDPADATLLDNAPVGDYLGEAAERTGDIVDTDPVLGEGGYECRGDTIVLRPDEDEEGGITWALARA